MNGMKIGQITLDGYYNYGNVLQKYALHKVLQNFGVVEYLWHRPENFLPLLSNKWSWKTPIKLILNLYGFRTKMFSEYRGMEMVRQGKIKDWCDRYIDTRVVTENVQDVSEEYDYFVVGSDQVWHPNYVSLETRFLFFAPTIKRVAYSASISCPSIPPEKYDMYKKGFKGMAHISMREEDGARLVREISGRDVPVLVDPTLLLKADEWRNVSRQPAWYKAGEYVLTYFLGAHPEEVANLEKKTGLKVVNLLDKKVYEHYVTGPDEFLWAIEHARLVYTDSFHGTVFSIIFNTPFVVCDRVGDEVTESMGSRIDTLLKYFGLESRRGTKENGYMIDNPLEAPNWSMVDSVLARERARSDAYLRMAFNVTFPEGEI